MSTKPRDHKAEYARRIELGLKRGHSKARARGHRPATRDAGPPRDTPATKRLEFAYDEFRESRNLSKSAKAARVSSERFRLYLRANKLVRKRGGHWSLLPDNRVRELEMLTTQGWKVVTVQGFGLASEIGEHRAAVKFFKDTGDEGLLSKFAGRAVTEVDGRIHGFETRPNVLLRVLKTGRGSFEQVYKIISR